jgi:hypothetical protein
MKMNYEILSQELPVVLEKLKEIDKNLGAIEVKMDEMQFPYTIGRIPQLK